MKHGVVLTIAFTLCTGLVASPARYPVTGLILKVDQPHRKFTASCAAIPGYMEAMIMTYSVRGEKSLNGLKPGLHVEFTLVVESSASYVEGIRVHHYQSAELEPLRAQRLQLLLDPETPNSGTRGLATGQRVPDFVLTDQAGKRVGFFPIRRQGCRSHIHLHELSLARLLFPVVQQLRAAQEAIRKQDGAGLGAIEYHLRSGA